MAKYSSTPVHGSQKNNVHGSQKNNWLWDTDNPVLVAIGMELTSGAKDVRQAM
jgi:hypothetical protein